MENITYAYYARASQHCTPKHFGPGSCSDEFDFTLLFEQSFFVIAPAAMFLLVTPWRLYRIRKASIKTIPSRMHLFKLFTASIYALLQLGLLVLWALDTQSGYAFTCGAYQARTVFLRREDIAIPTMLCCSIGIKMILLWLEAANKRRYLKYPFCSSSPEAIAGVISWTFLWWLNRIFITGFQKLMTYHDLFPVIPELRAKGLGERLRSSWQMQYSIRRTQPVLSKWTLPIATLSCFKWEILCVFPARLCLVGFNYAQPFLFARTIALLDEPVTQGSRNIGYGLIGATGLIYVGIALATVHYQQRMFRTLTMFRGAMVTLVFDHSLALPESSNAEHAAISHMSTDIDTLSRALVEINEVWARAIEVGLGVALLAREIGGVCVVPIVLVALSTYGQTFVAKTIGSKRMAWNNAVQKRISTTASMLGSIKSIKIMGLTSIVGALIQQACVHELEVSRGFMWLILALNFIAVIPSTWAPTLTFAVYAIQARVRHTESLGTAQAFTSLALLTLITSPATRLLTVLPQFASAMGCFSRLQKFLALPVVEKQMERPRSHPIGLRRPSEEPIEIELAPLYSRESAFDQTAISVNDITVRPAPDASPAVAGLSFKVAKASLAVLIGPTGSGKSTILRAILGELKVESGSVSMSSGLVGYCAQTPWLINSSIRQNICGPLSHGQEVDESWYGAVLHACCLWPDLLALPDGDLSIIGSKGITLSGGQRQRLALARAVYSRQPVLVLDDVLSALDQQTTNAVLERLFGSQGLLRSNGTTVILATHTDTALSFADIVILMDASGNVIRSGPPSTFSKGVSIPALTLSTPGMGGTRDPSTHSPINRKPAPKGPSKNDLKAVSAKTGDLKIYKYYFRSIGRSYFLAFLATTVAATFCTSFSQVWLQWWTSNGGAQLNLYLPVFALLALLSNISTNTNMWIMFLNIMPRSVTHLHSILLDTVIRAHQSFFSKTDAGEILNRFSQDISLISMTLPTSMLASGIAFFDSIAQAALICMGSTYMAITLPFLAAAIYAIQKVYLRTSRQLRFMDLEAKAPLYSHFLEMGEGVATVRAFGWQENAKDRNAELLDVSQSPYYLMYCIQRWLQLVLDLLVAVMAVVVVALAVSLRSSSSAGLMGIALNNILSFNQSLSRLVREWTNLETSLSAISRVRTFSATVDPEADCADGAQISPLWPSTGAIVFENVSAAYDRDASTSVLHNVDLRILPGEKVGICGRTGSGKSSLLLALLRLLDLTSGSITVDGVDVKDIPCDTLRSRLTAVPQDPFLLPGTLRQNLDMDKTLGDNDMIVALRKVHLWSILEDRGGLDMMMSKDCLSQGQLQLLSLARAMLQKTTILILDEATSSLDTETDRAIQDVIRQHFGSCTIIAIAHRLETIKAFDKIAVLEHGNLIGFDSPDVILTRHGATTLLDL